MRHQVVVTDVIARPTLVVATTTTWSEFPTVWRGLLDEVWAYLRASGIERGCRNVMLYRDDVPHVEVGVEAHAPGPLSGRVTSSSLPAGKVAMTTHRGSYSDLGAAHRAVIDWCQAQGKALAGPRWEVYGPHSDDPSEVWTEVYWLLASIRSRAADPYPWTARPRGSVGDRTRRAACVLGPASVGERVIQRPAFDVTLDPFEHPWRQLLG